MRPPGSRLPKLTSFTSVAPPSRTAASATDASKVSTDTGTPGPTSRRTASSTGITRASSSSGVTLGAPGLVLWPPTSSMSAPAATIRAASRAAAPVVACLPPSLKLSGVAFSTPMTYVLAPSSHSASASGATRRTSPSGSAGATSRHRRAAAASCGAQSPPGARRRSWSPARTNGRSMAPGCGTVSSAVRTPPPPQKRMSTSTVLGP
mmetsp:Transcript_22701/g.77232  ORF Transcript_22701/g.77232 Transcript_22701/m.77232 type:complete len:207 (-) Transcript_22701:319-939(-)